MYVGSEVMCFAPCFGPERAGVLTACPISIAVPGQPGGRKKKEKVSMHITEFLKPAPSSAMSWADELDVTDSGASGAACERLFAFRLRLFAFSCTSCVHLSVSEEADACAADRKRSEQVYPGASF